MWEQIRKTMSCEIGSWSTSCLFPSKKKKEITRKVARCCCELNNKHTGRPSSPVVVSAATRIYYWIQKPAVQCNRGPQRRGRTRLALRDTKSKWPRTCQDRRLRLFQADDDMPSPPPSSLDIDEKVSFQDVLALFVLL